MTDWSSYSANSNDQYEFWSYLELEGFEQFYHSPLRVGSADSIYLIPAPNHLGFGTGMILSAACCIPAILALTTLWGRIQRVQWCLVEKHNPGFGSTVITTSEILACSVATLVVLILGERNFWSPQVLYQTETISDIGKFYHS